ncbi:MAG: hypothetical protein IJE92_05780, partial [Clostridia bacterium]|nr:hypothetical protein [Clostridia bacterium]
GIGMISTIGVPAFLTLVPLVYNSVLKDAIALDPSKAMVLTVPIPTSAWIFIAVTVVAMTAVMVLGKVVIKKLENKKLQMQN